MTTVSICFLTQCRLIYGTTLIPEDVCRPSSTCTCSSVRAGRWFKVMNQFWSHLLLDFTTLFNILGHQRRFRHRAWKVWWILFRGSNFGVRFFYVLPKEVILRIFTLWKNPSTRPGSNPWTSDPEPSMITTGPSESTCVKRPSVRDRVMTSHDAYTSGAYREVLPT